MEKFEVTAISSAIAAVASSLITAIATRRRSKRDLNKLDLDNIHTAVLIWKEAAELLQKEVVNLRHDVGILTAQVKNLSKENHTLKQKIYKR